MKNLKTILFVLAFGLMSNAAFSQSKTIKVDKKSINSTPQTKQTMPSSNSQFQKSEIKSTSTPKAQPASSYTPASSNSNHQEVENKPQSTAPAKSQPVKATGNSGTIPANSIKRSKSESKK